MDVDALLAGIPDDAALQSLDVNGKKESVLDAIECVISALEAEDRSADVWEANMLLRAMAAILRAQYFVAANDLRLCLAPASQRSPDAMLETAKTMVPKELKEILNALRSIPAR